MKLRPTSAFPKVSKKAISVNPESERSVHIDKIVFNLYDQSKEKNGELVAYNQLVDFVGYTSIVRKNTIDQLITAEKWFKKGIDFIHKHQRPYLEKQDKDIKKVTSLLKEYPETKFENFLDDYKSSASQLAHMIHYLDSYKEYFDKVTTVDLGKSASEFYQVILEFDKIHLLHERSNDLVELISKKLCVEDLTRSDFIRTIDQIKIEESLKPGPKVPPKLLADIEDVIIDLNTQKKEIAGNAYFNENGTLIIKQALRYALEKPDFEKEWSNDSNSNGYSDRTLIRHFSSVYKKMTS